MHVEDAGVLCRRLARRVDGRLEADHPGQALPVGVVERHDALAQPISAGRLCVEFGLHLLRLLTEQAHGFGRELLFQGLPSQRVPVRVELLAQPVGVLALRLELPDGVLQRGRRQLGVAVGHHRGERLVERVQVLLGVLDRRRVHAEEADDGLLHLVEALGVDDLLQAVGQAAEVLAIDPQRFAADLARVAELGEGLRELVDVGLRRLALGRQVVQTHEQQAQAGAGHGEFRRAGQAGDRGAGSGECARRGSRTRAHGADLDAERGHGRAGRVPARCGELDGLDGDGQLQERRDGLGRDRADDPGEHVDDLEHADTDAGAGLEDVQQGLGDVLQGVEHQGPSVLGVIEPLLQLAAVVLAALQLGQEDRQAVHAVVEGLVREPGEPVVERVEPGGADRAADQGDQPVELGRGAPHEAGRRGQQRVGDGDALGEGRHDVVGQVVRPLLVVVLEQAHGDRGLARRRRQLLQRPLVLRLRLDGLLRGSAVLLDGLLVLLLRVGCLADGGDLRAERERVGAGRHGHGAQLPGERGRRTGQARGRRDGGRQQADQVCLERLAQLVGRVGQRVHAALHDRRVVVDAALRLGQ